MKRVFAFKERSALHCCTRVLRAVAWAVGLMYVSTEAGTLRVLPLGDSITYGTGSAETAGYRAPLRTMLQQAGYSVDFVGTRTDNPGTLEGVDAEHCGNPGWGVGAADGSRNCLYEHLPAWFSVIRDPHVVLLHIGTNETGSNQQFSDILERYGLLLDRIHAAQPDARVIATTLLWRGDNANKLSLVTDVFNAGITNLVAQQVAKGQYVTLVDMYGAVSCDTGNFSEDLVHPSSEGYERMAEAWFGEIARLFPDPAAAGSENAPAVVRHATDAGSGFAQATLWFNQPVSAATRKAAASYVLSDASFGAPSVTDVNDRTVRLQWAKSGYGRQLTLTVDGIANDQGVKTIDAQQVDLVFRDAGCVVWETPCNITGDADVVTEGDSLYAYTQSATATIVNGVTFKAGNGAGNFSATEKLPNLNVSGFSKWYSAFLPDDVACPAGMTVSYRQLINCGVYNVTSTGTAGLTLKNLVPGHRYLVQIWSNDSRANASTTTGVCLDDQVSINYRVAGTGFGQYAVGRFLAEDSEALITLSPVGVSGLSIAYTALQVRDITPDAIRWDPVQTIYDDTDIRTEGTLIGAYNGSAGNSFVAGGVTFAPAGGNAANMTAGVKLVSPAGEVLRNYYNAASPLNANATYPSSATDGYKSLLGALCYVSGTRLDVRMTDLEPGCRYLVQMWYNDSRNASYNYYLRVDSQRELDCQDAENGRRGKCVTGRFTATSPTRSFSFDGLQRNASGGNASLVAIQFRRLDAVPAPGGDWTGWKYATSAADVETSGTTVYACTPGYSDITVNGVTFRKQNGAVGSWEGGNVLITGMAHYHANAFMNTYSGPDLGTYKDLLQQAVWSSRAECPALRSEMTFKGLKKHTRYLLQVWVNDNRESGVKPAVEFGTGTRIPYRSPDDPHLGPIGFATIVTGDNTEHVITNVYGVVPGYSGDYSCPQINALQLREMPSVVDPAQEGFVEWTGYGAPWNAETGLAKTAVLSHGGTMTLSGDACCGGVFSSDDMTIEGTGGILCMGEISAPLCYIDAAWLGEDLSRSEPGTTVLGGAADNLRQIVVGAGCIDYASASSPATLGVCVAAGAVLAVETELTASVFEAQDGATVSFIGEGALFLPEGADLEGVVFDLRDRQASGTEPFLRAGGCGVSGFPACELLNGSFRIEREIDASGVENWYLRQSHGLQLLLR